MNCTKAQKLISLLIDGEASENQKRLLDFHLMGCPSCRRALRLSRDISRITHNLPAPAPPGDLEASVRKILKSGSDLDRPETGRRSALLAIPAVAALLLFVFTLLPYSSRVEADDGSMRMAVSPEYKSTEVSLSSKSGLRTAPLSEYTSRSSMVTF